MYNKNTPREHTSILPHSYATKTSVGTIYINHPTFSLTPLSRVDPLYVTQIATIKYYLNYRTIFVAT